MRPEGKGPPADGEAEEGGRCQQHGQNPGSLGLNKKEEEMLMAAKYDKMTKDVNTREDIHSGLGAAGRAMPRVASDSKQTLSKPQLPWFQKWTHRS